MATEAATATEAEAEKMWKREKRQEGFFLAKKNILGTFPVR